MVLCDVLPPQTQAIACRDAKGSCRWVLCPASVISLGSLSLLCGL